jgi:hypothetical protein
VIVALRGLAPRRRAGGPHAFLEDAHDVDHVARLGLVLRDALFDFDDVAVLGALPFGERE